MARQVKKIVGARNKRAKRKIEQLSTPAHHIESVDAAHSAHAGDIVLPLAHTLVPPVESRPRRKSDGDSSTASRRRQQTNVGKNAFIAKPVDWTRLPDERLLDMRMCDLGLTIEGTPLQSAKEKLYSELAARNLKLRPHCWLSDEWFAPDGIPGIAIPFYLAHPRLIRLERQQMLDVEGGTRAWCMKILRHEAGHAIDTAYAMHRKKRYREVFGSYSDPYPDFYRPKPRSKSFVQHLEPWYAQSHPAEDFAETFAVWLTPGKRWKKDYLGWKAMRKLELVDELMAEIADAPQKIRSRRKIDPVTRMKRTLREHYYQRHQRYNINYTTSFDHDLARLFRAPESRFSRKASTYLLKHRSEFCRTIAHWTGEYRYNINQVIREMIDRCRSLDLRVEKPDDQLHRETLIMLTVHTMNYLYRGNHQVAL